MKFHVLIWGTKKKCFGLIISANVTGNNILVLYKHYHTAKIDHHGSLKGTVQLKLSLCVPLRKEMLTEFTF